ncbi:MAG: TetR/AcrR family transcriptional regulator [Bacteroidales bacterium]|nr:TetR/AcrR family transcriptional regulator [Bacteroidales bacterium]
MKKSTLKDQIVQISREVFSTLGFRKASVEEIARVLRKKKSSIYYHFKSKESLFEAVLEYEANILRQQVMKKLLEQRSASDKLKVYVKSRMLYIRQLINFYNALKDDYFNQMPFIEKLRKKFDDEEIGIIRNILVEGIVTKEFNITRPDLAAVAIFTAMKGLEIPFMKENDDIEEKINYLMDILFYGIKTK